MSVRRSAAVTTALVGAGVALAAGASANPPDPTVDPAPPPTPATEPAPAPPLPPAPEPTGLIPTLSAIGTVMAQTGSEPSGPLGLPDLSAYGPALLLGQNPVPLAPDVPAAPVIPSLNAFGPDFLVPLNTVPAAPGSGEPAPGIGPDAESPGTGRIAFLRRLNEMYQAGLLDGALLGQQSPEEFEAAQTTPTG